MADTGFEAQSIAFDQTSFPGVLHSLCKILWQMVGFTVTYRYERVMELAIACTAGCNSIVSQRQAMNAQDAAVLAANLANDECERLYDARPFSGKDHIPELREVRWYWGRLDPAGPQGMSAKVSFDLDGSNAEVIVYYSSDLGYI